MALRENLAEWSKTPFESRAHQLEAMRDVQYRNIPEYRAAVAAKIALDDSGIAPAVHSRAEPVYAGLGEQDSDRKATRAQEHASAEEELVATYGWQAGKPAPIAPQKELSARDRSQWNNGEQLSSVRILPDF